MSSQTITTGKGKGRSLMAHRLFAIIIALVAFTSGMKLMAKEAYAVYKENSQYSVNNTLTFYYDDKRLSRSGIVYVLNTGDNFPGWIGKAYGKVIFDSSFKDARPTTTRMGHQQRY